MYEEQNLFIIFSYLIMLNSLHGQIPRLRVESVERAYVEHKKCLKQCLQGFETGTMSQPEKACVVGCLSKYRQAERYMAEKVHRLMTEHAAQSQEVSSLYDSNMDKSSQKNS